MGVGLLLYRLWSAARWSPCALTLCLKHRTTRMKQTPKVLGCHGYILKSSKVMKGGKAWNHLHLSYYYYFLSLLGEVHCILIILFGKACSLFQNAVFVIIKTLTKLESDCPSAACFQPRKDSLRVVLVIGQYKSFCARCVFVSHASQSKTVFFIWL